MPYIIAWHRQPRYATPWHRQDWCLVPSSWDRDSPHRDWHTSDTIPSKLWNIPLHTLWCRCNKTFSIGLFRSMMLAPTLRMMVPSYHWVVISRVLRLDHVPILDCVHVPVRIESFRPVRTTPMFNVQRQYWIVFTVILKNVAARDLATKRPLAPNSDSLKCSTRREAAPNMWGYCHCHRESYHKL